MDHRIPRINLSYCTGLHLINAFTDVGVLLLEGGCDPEKIRGFHHDARVAFTELAHLCSQPYNGVDQVGYTPPGVERTVRSERTMLRHFFDYRAGFATLSTDDVRETALHKFYTGLVANTRSVLRRLDPIVGCSSLIEDGPFVLRIAEALNDRNEPFNELFPPHKDFGLFTVFVGGAYAGLQVKVGGGWIPVAPGPGEYLIAPGTLFAQYYPKAKVPEHRVMGTNARRISFTLFVDPGPDIVLPEKVRVRDYFARMHEQVREKVA